VFKFELAVALFFVLLILILIVYYAIRYRRLSNDEIPAQQPTHFRLEATWTSAVFILVMVMFFWGAKLFITMKKPLENAMEIHVIGKQWMWKIEHPGGVREINSLHVPVGQPIQLIMASQDVIHDFFIPAFRIKQDVVPGSYMSQWFVATEPGEYHLFCSQYCGTDHANMVGTVTVMLPMDYQAWLAGALPAEPAASAGQKLFTSYGCAACHGQRGPTMAGLYGRRVQLQNGSTVLADENYLRDSILHPQQQIVAGYPPIMPSYRGQLTEEQLFQIIAYIKSLGPVRNVPTSVPATRPASSAGLAGDAPSLRRSPSVVPNYPPTQTPYPLRPVQRNR